jgi:hypothetical protein
MIAFLTGCGADGAPIPPSRDLTIDSVLDKTASQKPGLSVSGYGEFGVIYKK